MKELNLFRLLFILIVAASGYLLRPLDHSGPWGMAIAGLVAIAALLFENRLKQVSLSRLIGAAIGGILGMSGSYLAATVISQAVPRDSGFVPFLQIMLLSLLGYIGLVVGAAKGEILNLAAFGGNALTSEKNFSGV